LQRRIADQMATLSELVIVVDGIVGELLALALRHFVKDALLDIDQAGILHRALLPRGQSVRCSIWSPGSRLNRQLAEKQRSRGHPSISALRSRPSTESDLARDGGFDGQPDATRGAIFASPGPG